MGKLTERLQGKEIPAEDMQKFEAIDEVLDETVKAHTEELSAKAAELEKKQEATEAALLDVKKSLEGMNKKEEKKMKKSIEEQLREQLKNYISVENGVEKVDLKKAAQENGNNLKLTLDTKAAGTILTGSILYLNAASEDDVYLPIQENVLRSVADVTRASARAITIAEIAAGEGGANKVAEGAAKPQMDTDYSERTVPAVKIAVWEKFSEETLYDFPAFVNECMRLMIVSVRNAEETNILTDITLPTYTSTAITGVVSPNRYDAIEAARNQIASATGGYYRPNALLLNPADYTLMKLTKATDGQYLFSVIEQQLGLRIVESTNVTAGSFILGDFNYLHIRDWQPVEISVGWVNADFTNNLVTVVAEERVIYYVKAQDAGAFVKDTFSNVLTAIA
jgi:HK97 family phage major capsid protein